MTDAIKGLMKSRKALVFLVIIGVTSAMVFSGKLAAQEWMDQLKWLAGTWFGAHAWEEGKKAEAAGNQEPGSSAAD